MMINIISFFIVIFANIIGAFAGMGGGIIIKPLVSILCHFPLATVIFYSNLSVIVMCLTSFTYNKMTKSVSYGKKTVPIVLGSLCGGLLGTIILNGAMRYIHDMVKPIQITLTIVTLLISLWYQWRGKPLSQPFTKKGKIFLVGLIMGSFAVILGIGGGPINVWLLMMFLALPLKKATSYSLLSVMAAVAIRLLSDFSHLSSLNPSPVTMWVFIISAFIGSLIGILIKRHLPTYLFKKMYVIVLIGVIIINVVNLLI